MSLSGLVRSPHLIQRLLRSNLFPEKRVRTLEIYPGEFQVGLGFPDQCFCGGQGCFRLPDLIRCLSLLILQRP
jgi:hypothetical protein